MKNRKLQFWQAMVLSLFLWGTGYAQITPLGDSFTNTADSTTNYGNATLLYVNGADQVTYIQFNLASIPATATINQATLKLYVNSVTTAGSFNVDYVNGSWTESTIDASNAPGLGTTIASEVDVTTADKNQYILINVTSAVQAWLSGSETNNGIALVANSKFNATFDSKENTTTSHPAELDIAFAGGDGTITGVTTASGSGLTGGGTSGTLNLGLTNACATNQVLQWNGSTWACSSAGAGTITGVTAGTDLTGGGTSGNVTLNLNTSALNSTYAQLTSANTFTGNQTVNGNMSATGVVTGSGFQIGSNLFDYGSYANQNAFLGFAGNSTMTGVGNTASGLFALLSNTTGSHNTAGGSSALYANTTGAENTASGQEALEFNTSGGQNTASGVSALQSNITGSQNTANGVNALFDNTTGWYNTASGLGALSNNTTGGGNTASGYVAGLTLDNSYITGSNNSFLGADTALSTGTLSNATAIGASAEVAESNALVLGSIKGINGAGNSVNVGIGTSVPAYALDVYGTGHFTQAVTFGSPVMFASGQTFPGAGTITGVTAGSGLSGGGSSGSVTLNNTGVLSITAGTGISSSGGQSPTVSNTGILALTAGTGVSLAGGQSPTISVNTAQVPLLSSANTFTGNQTVNGNLNISTGSSFQIGGNLFAYGSFANENVFLGFAGNTTTTGKGGNTASGYAALQDNTTGYYNTASGTGALQNNTTGYYNTASGYAALLYNTTGNSNTASGIDALYSNTTGGNNTASGYFALGLNTTASNNTAHGYQALYSNTTGGANTAVGVQALDSNTTASYSTAVGYQALLHSTGNGNTGVGYNALYSTTSGTNNTGFGNGALGGNSTGSFNTAVGYNAGPVPGSLINATAIGSYAEVTENNALVLGSISGTNGATASTNVGIGTTEPGNQLDVYVQTAGEIAVNAVGYNAPQGSGNEGGAAFVSSGGNADPTSSQTGAEGMDSYGGIGPGGDGPGGVFYGGDSSLYGDGMDVFPGSGMAGSFFGDVGITGTLSKASGSFKIDDPLDPANKYLYHSFVESPDMMNVYNGNVVLDASGEAVVDFPEWFGLLNRDFRYQLTCIGGYAPVYVAEEISSNRFKIAGGRPGLKVSWQVTGIRQDRWANAHRIPVEQEKEPRLRGFYIHPELYGAPPEKQIEWARHPQMMKQMREHEEARRARMSAVQPSAPQEPIPIAPRPTTLSVPTPVAARPMSAVEVTAPTVSKSSVLPTVRKQEK